MNKRDKFEKELSIDIEKSTNTLSSEYKNLHDNDSLNKIKAEMQQSKNQLDKCEFVRSSQLLHDLENEEYIIATLETNLQIRIELLNTALNTNVLFELNDFVKKNITLEIKQFYKIRLNEMVQLILDINHLLEKKFRNEI